MVNKIPRGNPFVWNMANGVQNIRINNPIAPKPRPIPVERLMADAAREAARQQFIREAEDPQPRPLEDFLIQDDDFEPDEAGEPEELPPPPGWGRVQVEAAPDAAWAAIRKAKMHNIKEGPDSFRSMTERSTRLPRFKLEYASSDEARMRLEGTLITVQDRMVKVIKIQMVRQGGEHGLGCVALDENGDNNYLLFSKEGMNFRSPDPGYIQVGEEAYMFRRRPARVYKQGITGENTHFCKVGRNAEQTRLFGAVPDMMLIRAFNERPIIQFEEGLMDNVRSLRLSDRVAVFKRNGGKLHVEHRGHTLGVLEKGKVRVENSCLWVENALNAVGIKVIPVEG